jgi:hypothetical protein
MSRAETLIERSARSSETIATLYAADLALALARFSEAWTVRDGALDYWGTRGGQRWRVFLIS